MSCLCNNTRSRKKINPGLHSIPVGEPFACIGMDFKEIDESFDKNRFALVFQDYLSKWPEIYPVADRTASTVAKRLVYRHGVPSTIIHDRAPDYLMYYKILLLFLESNNYQPPQVTHNVTA